MNRIKFILEEKSIKQMWLTEKLKKKLNKYKWLCAEQKPTPTRSAF